mmetsp:Transcript_62322/g.135376  ORF Transcript_62322/g.135376 Transcript_62322/m.135376 type:complete len:222 (-) Transcript_62322:110-775(-)
MATTSTRCLWLPTASSGRRGDGVADVIQPGNWAAGNGRRPVRHWNIITPTAHRSEATLWRPAHVSGAMKAGVPRRRWPSAERRESTAELVGSRGSVARPKSTSLTTYLPPGSARRRTLAGFTSRCNTFASCAWARPVRHCAMKSITDSGESRFWSRSSCCNVGPSMYSMMIAGCGVSMMSCTLTTLAVCSLAFARASFKKRRCDLELGPPTMCSTLTATCL